MTCQKRSIYMYVMRQKSGRSVPRVFVAEAYTELSGVFGFFRHLLSVSRLLSPRNTLRQTHVCGRHTL